MKKSTVDLSISCSVPSYNPIEFHASEVLDINLYFFLSFYIILLFIKNVILLV